MTFTEDGSSPLADLRIDVLRLVGEDDEERQGPPARALGEGVDEERTSLTSQQVQKRFCDGKSCVVVQNSCNA